MLLASFLERLIRFGCRSRELIHKPVSQCVPLHLVLFVSVLMRLIIYHRRHGVPLNPKAFSSACLPLHSCPTQDLLAALVPVNFALAISKSKDTGNY
jgi:hypothetical protein